MIGGPDTANTLDRDLEKRVITFLESHQRVGLRRLRVEAQQGSVTLRGVVGSFYEKQLCLRCCRHVAGVVMVIDEIEVVSPESS